MKRRIIQALDRLLNMVIIGFCAIFLFVSGYSLLDNYWLYKNANDDSLLAYKPPETPEEEESDELSSETSSNTTIAFISAKQAGWLQVYDTPIDYPLMRGEDNFEFLNLDPYEEFKLSGSIFMDYRNKSDFTDDYIVVYGHHMEYGSMFGSLDAFTDKDYFDAHTKGRIVTRDGSYELELFAVADGDGADQTLFDPTGRTTEEITAYLDENAMIDTGYRPGNRIVALTTCWGDTISSRLLVFGMLV